MDVLLSQSYLIARDPPERKIMRPFPPLGIMSLASYLRKNNIDVSIFDNTFKNDLKGFEDVVVKRKPILVGISVVETSRDTALQMVEIAKKAGAKVIVGGPDPVNARDIYYKSGVDWICEGEGENTLFELSRSFNSNMSINVDEARGLYYWRNDSERYTGKRELIKDLDSIPLSAWDLIDIQRYIETWRDRHGESSLHLISSRGCPRSCAWCSRSVFGRTFRQRSPSNFVEEIEFLKNTYSPDYFWFADDSFTSNENWLLDFENELRSRDLDIQYECLGRVDEITDAIARKLKSTGAQLIWFGAESGSQRILDSMRKGFSVEDVRKAREIVGDYQIKVGFFIILGYPPEDVNDVYRTVGLIRNLKPDRVGVSIAYPISGTEFYEKISNNAQISKRWTSSGENRVVYRTKYHPLFYRFARRLILKEAQLIQKNHPPNVLDNTKLGVYKLGTRILSLGSVGK